MSEKFVGDQWLSTETCCACGVLFAMPSYLHQKFREDSNLWFYCPNGHRQHYTVSVVDRLKKELQEAHREIDRALETAARERQRVAQISRSYNRVRQRVRNGVCPCCNRTFDNLARHMATKHPDYGDNKSLRGLRLAFGLTQRQLAEEAGVPAKYVSLFERGMELPKSAEKMLRDWLEHQTAAA